MLRWDRSLLGKEFGRFEQHVTRAMLLEYADIIGAKDPVYTDPQRRPGPRLSRHHCAADVCRLAWRPPHRPTRDGFSRHGHQCGVLGACLSWSGLSWRRANLLDLPRRHVRKDWSVWDNAFRGAGDHRDQSAWGYALR